MNPCGEVIFKNNFCNLSEVMLNLLDPFDFRKQKEVFKSAALLATPLLKHVFTHPSHQKSRELDPIVGVSISGVFDFFVMLFQDDYLLWMNAGRPEDWKIQEMDSLCICLYFGLYTMFEGRGYIQCDEAFLLKPTSCFTST